LDRSTPKKCSRPGEVLYAGFPVDVDTLSFQNNLAGCAHRASDWFLALHLANKARSNMVVYLQGPKKSCRDVIIGLVGNLYYIEVNSLASLGRFDEAKSVLDERQEFMNHNTTMSPWSDISGVAGRGDWRTIVDRGYYIPLLKVTAADLETRRKAASTVTVKTPGQRAQALLESMKWRAQLNDTASFKRRRANDWNCATQLVVIGEATVGDRKELASVVRCIEAAISDSGEKSFRLCNDYEAGNRERDLAHRIDALLLHSEGIPEFRHGEDLPNETLLGIADRIMAVHEQLGTSATVAGVVRPLMEAPFPPALGFNLILRISMSGEDCQKYVKGLIARCPEGVESVPSAVWLRLAEAEQGARLYRDALEDYARGFKHGTPTNYCIGLSVSLIHVAVENDADRPAQEIERLCRARGIPPFAPNWRHWMNVGRERQKALQYRQATACYRQALSGFVPNEDYNVNLHDLLILFLAQCLEKSGNREGEDVAVALRSLVRKHGRSSVQWGMRWYPNALDNIENISIGIEANSLLELMHQQAEPMPQDGATNTTGKAAQGK
ncbi:MAG: hypothetical protein WCS01_13845, partial [bacterium]